MNAEQPPADVTPLPPTPYVGLNPYTEAERRLFIGRDRDATLLRNKILSNPLTLLYAPSGVGKTSLLKAVVAPELRELDAVVLHFDDWVVSAPYPLLLSRIKANLDQAGESTQDNDSLSACVKAINDELQQSVVLILDQFEEFMIHHREQLDPLRSELASLLRADLDVHVVLSLREEFLASLEAFSGQILNLFNSTYRLKYLDQQRAREAIVQPAELFGVTYETGLVDCLLEQLTAEADEAGDLALAGGAIELPFLQLICDRLWAQHRGDTITLELYRQLGEREGILKLHVRGLLAGLDANERRDTALLLDLLAPPIGIKMAYPLDVLKKLTALEQARLEKLLENLDRQRVLRARETSGGASYQLYHDAYIKILRPWVDAVLRKVERRRKILSWIKGGAYVVPVVLLALFWLGSAIVEERVHERQEYDRTWGRIEWLRSQAAEQQAELSETVFNDIAGYLWSKQEQDGIDTLVQILSVNQELIPEDYGRDSATTKTMVGVRAGEAWPLTLHYNPKRRLNERRFQEMWRQGAKSLSDKGLVVPMRIKLQRDDTVPLESVIIKGPKEDAAESTLMKEKPVAQLQQSIYAPIAPQHVVIKEHELDPRLLGFFEQNKQQWIQLKDVDFVGNTWLVPAWTAPLWQVTGQAVWPQEYAIVLLMVNRLLDNPAVLMTYDAVLTLLVQAYNQDPVTVDEAVVAQGGLIGLGRILAEVVRAEEELSVTSELLDSIANYPGMQAVEVTDRALKELSSMKGIPSGVALRGQTGQPELPAPPEDDFTFTYNETSHSLAPLPPPVRIYLGEALAQRFIDDGLLTDEVLDALGELSAALFQRYGVEVPGVMFYAADDPPLQATSFHLEFLLESRHDQGSQAIQVTVETGLKRVIQELWPRYTESIAAWLNADDVEYYLDTLPEEIRDWLMTNYTLTDLKLILRMVLLLDDSANSLPNLETAEQGDKRQPYQSIRHLPWLLTSLVFWNRICPPLDGECLATGLQMTQAAGLSPLTPPDDSTPTTQAVIAGIGKLLENDAATADDLFFNAVAFDDKRATRTFLAYYPNAMAAMQQEWIGRSCLLPEPGDMEYSSPPPWIVEYELVDLLNNATNLDRSTQNHFELCLTFAYMSDGRTEKASPLLQSLLQRQQLSEFSADEAYSVGYWLLRQAQPQPEQQHTAFALIRRAYQRWAETVLADSPITARELVDLCRSSTGEWCWTALRELAIQSDSYWLPSELAFELLLKENRNLAQQALALLEYARHNLGILDASERPEQKAWLDFGNAYAYYTLGIYDDRASLDRSLELFMALLDTLPAAAEQELGYWPSAGDVYHNIFNIYVLRGETEQAIQTIRDGLNHEPESTVLLQAKFFAFLMLGNVERSANLALQLMQRDNNDPGALFLAALSQLLIGEEESGPFVAYHKSGFEHTARRFIGTEHEYSDYIRMMLYWTLNKQGNEETAAELLQDRWVTIDPSSWEKRLEHDDINVWREMLIGYYLGEVTHAELFDTIEDPERFEQSAFARLGQSRAGFLCEAYFYDGLLQDVRGDKQAAITRWHLSADKGLPIYFEYHMARYLAAD